MKKLVDKVAIVTGGGSGIGRATAELFASEGARVAVADMNAAAAEGAARGIAGAGGSALAVTCDIGREDEVRAMVAATVERFGRVDVLVNNAARFLMKGAADASAEDWNAVLSTNVAGAALCSRYAAERMKASGGGAIVVVSSMNGLEAEAGYATYATSKSALLMLTRCMAVDFGPAGIRVNSICPGAVDTPALRRELARTNTSWAQMEVDLFKRQSVPRVIQADDIARSILFLVSDDARMITGANLVVDGGFSGHF